MRKSESSSEAPRESFDEIARDLQRLRDAAGQVSYAELVRRITALRMQRGVPAAAAVPARSTVYNAFATGRTRMDEGLLRDIVLSLGASAEDAERWVVRVRAARRSRVVETPGSIPATLLDAPAARTLSTFPMLLMLVALVALNHCCHWFLASPLDLPVYLDMVGTAVAAIAFGPWHGAAVAIGTGLTGPLFEDGILAFTLVNIAGALVWGYGVRRWRLGRDILGYFVLNLMTATACSLVATPILVVIRGGAYGSVGRIAESLQTGGMPFLAATFTSNISTSILDKLLTGFLALAIFAFLHSRLRLPARHMPLVEKLSSTSERRSRGVPRGGVIAQL